MEKQKMTIHRALTELKLIEAKIEKKILEVTPCGIKQKDKLVNGFIKEEDFKTSATSAYDSVTDLIARKCKIKSEIVKANSLTTVKVGGVDMTIAEAINFKAVVIYKKKLIEKLKSGQQKAVGEMNKHNEIVEKNVQAIVEAAMGKDNANQKTDTATEIRKQYINANEFILVDPLIVADKITVLEEEVSKFEADVDAALSEINATTFIEF